MFCRVLTVLEGINMRNKAIKGDIIAIPIDDKFIYGKVIFVSKRSKDIMQIECRGPYDSDKCNWKDGNFVTTFFTAASKFSKRGWKIISEGNFEGCEISKTLRIIADGVWEEDNFLRDASPEDHKNIQAMYVSGFIYIEKKLQGMIQS